MPERIAILIPCYNSALTLPELFDGINSQTVPFDEVICYDDFSSDNTASVAERLGAKVIKGIENKGPAFARNRLIEASTCKFIHFHDADDVIDERFVEVMKKHIVDENTQLLCNSFVYDRVERNVNLGNIVYDELIDSSDQIGYFLKNVGFASMGIYSKMALENIKGFNESLTGNEDPDLHVRLSIAGFPIKAVREFLVTKLEHSDSLSHRKWFQCLSDKFKCIEFYSTILDSKYFPILSNQSAELSNFFYREGDKSLSKSARKLAFKLDLNEMNNSRFSTFISTYFGVKFYLWLYRRRVDFKLL
jgi:glycosyltransferase involved in cell wall biosynthesis